MEEDLKNKKKTDERGAYRIYMPLGRLMFHNFLGGMAWGLGTVIGATIVVAILLFLMRALGGVPLIGETIRDILQGTQGM